MEACSMELNCVDHMVKRVCEAALAAGARDLLCFKKKTKKMNMSRGRSLTVQSRLKVVPHGLFVPVGVL